MKLNKFQEVEKMLKELSLYDVIKLFASKITPEGKLPDVESEQESESDKDKYLTGAQVDELLQISNVTRHRYANEGLLTRHKISRKKVLYRKDEVLRLLQAKEAGIL